MLKFPIWGGSQQFILPWWVNTTIVPSGATTFVLPKCPIISEQVVIVFMAYKVTKATVESV